MNYTFCAQTDPGRIRDNNEDSVAFDAATNLGVLADGMGGYNAGEIASSMATVLIKSELARWLVAAGSHANAQQVGRAMEICVNNANLAIFNSANTNPQYAGMGTTLVVGIFQETRLLLGHVGDSRCYRWRGYELVQVTKDHSFLQEQLDAGLLTPEQAAQSPNKNLVTRALGVEEQLMLELHEHQVEEGDIYLMCSDGLSDMIPDETIASVLLNDLSLTQMADKLVFLANQEGGRDNISVLLVKATRPTEKRGLISRWLGKH
jgi:serine/threonine protein phosphatase PrpC